MPEAATPLPHVASPQSRLTKAVEQLDEKLGSMDEWMSRTESDLDHFQARWQSCTQNITAQLARVEEVVTEPQAPPHLRIF